MFLLSNLTVQRLLFACAIDPDSRAVKRQVHAVSLFFVPRAFNTLVFAFFSYRLAFYAPCLSSIMLRDDMFTLNSSKFAAV